MRFASLVIGDHEQACLRRQGDMWIPLNELSSSFTGDLLTLIRCDLSQREMWSIQQQADRHESTNIVHSSEAQFRPPYRHPRMIWGIGLNYADHANDLSESPPAQPASFIKGDHTIIGPGDEIILPSQSERTTGEAEIGLVMGRATRNVDASSALDYVFGICPVLDQTAEDILQQNPRYLTRAKNFPTFFSFGPEVVTLDEILEGRPLEEVGVATYINGEPVRHNVVGNMTHSPAELVSFHSQMMPLYAGDIISTGTPGAGVLHPGARAEAHIDGLAILSNTVRAEHG